MKYNKITTHKEATNTILNLRQDINHYTNDDQLAKDINISKLTLYKRLAFSDWKPLEISRINEYLNKINNNIID